MDGSREMVRNLAPICGCSSAEQRLLQRTAHRHPRASQRATGTEQVGFTGFYWVLMGFTEFYWNLFSYNKFYRALPSFTGFSGDTFRVHC